MSEELAIYIYGWDADSETWRPIRVLADGTMDIVQ